MAGSDIPPPVQAVVDAINVGDTEGFVDAYTDDGRIDDWGRVLSGRDGVCSWAASDAIGRSARMTVTDASTDEDTTHLVFDWASTRFNGSSEAYVTVRDGKVAEFRIPAH